MEDVLEFDNMLKSRHWSHRLARQILGAGPESQHLRSGVAWSCARFARWKCVFSSTLVIFLISFSVLSEGFVVGSGIVPTLSKST